MRCLFVYFDLVKIFSYLLAANFGRTVVGVSYFLGTGRFFLPFVKLDFLRLTKSGVCLSEFGQF